MDLKIHSYLPFIFLVINIVKKKFQVKYILKYKKFIVKTIYAVWFYIYNLRFYSFSIYYFYYVLFVFLFFFYFYIIISSLIFTTIILLFTYLYIY